MPALRGFVLLVLVLGTLPTALVRGDEPKDLQQQLAAAEHKEPPDQAAIAEISRRILESDPHNQSVWEKRVRALLEIRDLKRCGEALDAWDHEDKQILATANDLAGDLADAEEKPDKAVEYWTSYLKIAPKETKTYEKIAWAHEQHNRWDKAGETLTKLIGVEDSAGTRVWRARCRMELRQWDDALADIKKAAKLDSSDEVVKTWLPQFESLEKVLPKIKDLDRKIAGGKPPQPSLLLDRGLLLYHAERYDLALEDADAALAITPKSKRAILQKAQALISLRRMEDAGKLRFIVANNNFSDTVLQKIGALDAKLESKPDDAGLLTARARECSDVDQYGLALEDADAAVKLAPKSAEALVEQGFARMKLDDANEAKRIFQQAADLDPKNAVAWRSLGELAMEIADYPAAIEDFSRSLKLHESPKVLQKREQCYRNSGHDKEADQDFQRWQKLTAKPSPRPTATTPSIRR